MDKYPLLIYGVSSEEFRKIKNCEKWFQEEVLAKSDFNLSIRYNTKRHVIGIFHIKEDKEKLILYENYSGIKNEEMACIKRFKETLESKLDELKIQNENWHE